MLKAEAAVIGGTGLETLFGLGKHQVVDTPYGPSVPIAICKIGKRKVAFLPRHGADHSIPPHKINYRANICALHEVGVERMFATNAVGAITSKLKPGQIVIPHDFVDFTKSRPATFHDESPVTHVDLSQPYCPQMRNLLIASSKKQRLKTVNRAVLVCTEGPRFETPAEIRMFRHLGCDLVGMTELPEVVLAKELGMCYASFCYVSNMATGMQRLLTSEEVMRVSARILPVIEQVLIDSFKDLPLRRNNDCRCSYAPEHARFA